MRKYSELSNDLQEEAREWRPFDFEEWEYKTRGVEIEFCARGSVDCLPQERS